MSTIRIYHNWWPVFVKGLIAIIFGLFATFGAGITLKVLMMYLGILISASAALLLVIAINNSRKNLPYQNWLYEGLLDLIIGLVIIFYPDLAVSILVSIIAIAALIFGIYQLVKAIRNPAEAGLKWMLVVNALIVIIFAGIMLYNPTLIAEKLLFVFGLLILIFGVFLVFYAFQLKKVITP